MWSSLFVNIIISILIIFIAHSLWNYIKNTYSTKKTKDLIGSQIQKYKSMLEEIQNQREKEKEKEYNQMDPSEEITIENDLAKWMEERIREERIREERIREEESLQLEFQK
jgi:glucan phosphoethanolaminetransferase (alkaline phosphatase superfamily)